MRLTRKLSVVLALGVLVVLAIYGVVRLRLNVIRFRDEVSAEHVALAESVAAMIENVAPIEGEARARAIVEAIARREPHATIAWIASRDASSLAQSFDDAEDPPRLVTDLPIRLGDRPAGVVEVVELFTREAVVSRRTMVSIATTSAIVLALCIALIFVFGARLVGRPLEALRSHAQRIGAGERGLRTAIDSSDEIGDLAREMNVMARSLDEAAARTRAEEAARLATLEHLRHADRLRTVGELAASVAHDLGTPMGAASARAQMIANGEVDAQRGRELAALIEKEIERMSGTIRALLDHARREPPHIESVDVALLANEVASLLGPLAEPRRVRLAVRGRPYVASLDRNLMRQVLVNLVMNAIDASPRGAEVAVEIDDGRVAVVDRGPGIPDDRLEVVFEPFVTTKPAGEGTGLGLSVARGIVEEHGGTLVAAARVGGGARFEIRLPAETRIHAAP